MSKKYTSCEHHWHIMPQDMWDHFYHIWSINIRDDDVTVDGYRLHLVLEAGGDSLVDVAINFHLNTSQ